MIVAIRISGDVEIPKEVREALFRSRLRRKYSAVLFKPTKQNIKILKFLRNYIAYGEINEETLKLLIEKRASMKNKKEKTHSDEIINQIEKREHISWSIKPFFRLHPPIGGIDSKNHFGTSKKSVLGDNKEKINDLLRRML